MKWKTYTFVIDHCDQEVAYGSVIANSITDARKKINKHISISIVEVGKK